MICIPGLCIKCSSLIHAKSLASKNYEEIVFRMSDGSTMHVGVCSDCKISPDEFPEVMSAVNAAWKSQGATPSSAIILAASHRVEYTDILRRSQGGRCLSCHDAIKDRWVVTQGIMLHEKCKLPGVGNVVPK